MGKISTILIVIIILPILILRLPMKKAIENQTYNTQLSEMMRRISKLEALLNGVPITTAKIADLAVTSAKIKNLTWDKGQGGTLSLGGVDNVDGEMSIKDGAGVEKIILDKDGVVINDGKIIIKNENSKSIIDSKGLNGLNVFSFDSINNVNSRTISSSSFVDVDNTSITTDSFSSSKKVMVIMSANVTLLLDSTDDIVSGEIVLNVDGTNKTGTIYDKTVTGTRMATPSVFSFNSSSYDITAIDILTLGTGNHTFKIQAKIDSQKLVINQTSTIYLILGN